EPRKERLPQRLLERLRALLGDADAIAMRPLDRLAGPLAQAVLEPVPGHGREEEREVAGAVRRHALGLRKQRQHHRRAGAREAGHEDGRGDAYVLHAPLEELRLELAEAAKERREAPAPLH